MRQSPLFYFLQKAKIKLGILKLKNDDLEILGKHFSYYRQLNSKHQKDFENRLVFFLSIKQFIPRKIERVTREMELLIGATAVMISFGFQDVTLKHFKKILVYNDNYYSTINKQYHQGEVNPRLGIIVISWKNFVRGMENESDGVNLGIHEMAHALKLENQIHYNGESNFFNPKRWMDFSVLAKKEIERIMDGEESIFRNSAANNPHEFFAIALESFFENPQRLKDYDNGLYQSLVFLLKQDPIVLSNGRS
jgi:Mlc titration factor MtfA (ptsG expression regulator)